MTIESPSGRTPAIQQIRHACRLIGAELMKIHPALPALADKPCQDEIIKTLYLLTQNLEGIKKQLARLEARDDSALV